MEQLRPIFAIVRGWCGREAVEEFLEVDRLQGIIKDLARWLKDSGHPLKAALLLKELGRSDEDG